jgi:hypothetical protein
MTLQAVMPIVLDAFRDTVPMVPVLVVLYSALELLSHGQGSRLLTRSSLPRTVGPIAGAVLGVIPQCGMSVFITSLFLAGRVSTGTLIATYLATSDEAIPVLLAHGGHSQTILLLLAVKLATGIAAGSIVDLVLPVWRHGADARQAARSWIQAHTETEMRQAPWSRALGHGLRRALEVFGWVLAVSIGLGLLVETVGLARLASGVAANPAAALILTAVVGLVPNCSISIAIAEGYLRGVLPFGAAVAGLCAGAGYGPILMLRRGLLATAARLLAVCLLFSVAAGLLVTLWTRS